MEGITLHLMKVKPARLHNNAAASRAVRARIPSQPAAPALAHCHLARCTVPRSRLRRLRSNALPFDEPDPSGFHPLRRGLTSTEIEEARDFLNVKEDADLEDILFGEKCSLEEDMELDDIDHRKHVKNATRALVDELLNQNQSRPLVLKHFKGVRFCTGMDHKPKYRVGPTAQHQAAKPEGGLHAMQDLPLAYGHLRVLGKCYSRSSSQDDYGQLHLERVRLFTDTANLAWLARIATTMALCVTHHLAQFTRTVVHQLETIGILP